MERFTNVLYLEGPSTHSRRALARALDVAWRHGARLTVGHVVDGSLVEPGASQRMEWTLRRARDRMAAVAANGPCGVDVEFRALDDECPSKVARIVRDGGYDLVMTLVAERAPLRPWSTGRIERDLLHLCPCPVWFVDAAQTNPVRDVLVAVDVGEGHSPALNRRLLETAADIADRADASLHVVHAWGLAGEAVLTSPVTGVGRARLVRMRADERLRRRRRVEALLARTLPEASARVQVAEGDAAPVIREAARTIEADVVVVGNSSRRGIAALVFGNLAERLIGCVPSSVLVLPEERVERSRAERSASWGAQAWDGGAGHVGPLEVRS